MDAMTDPSVEEIVARLEERIRFVGATGLLGHIDPTELAALIASWRERGEALSAAKLALEYASPDEIKEAVAAIDAALKDKP
jgi:hypothetical protein